MAEDQTGVLVKKIYADTCADGIVTPGDVILSIAGEKIASNGTVEFREGERTSFAYYAQEKYVGDALPLQILREGEILDVELKLSMPIDTYRLVPYKQYDTAPTYYIAGGLVFEPLTENFLSAWGSGWRSRAPGHLVNYWSRGEPTEDRTQVVFLVKVLADEINLGYHESGYSIIAEVNGKPIGSMRDLVSAFEEHDGEYHTILDEKEGRIVLRKSAVDQYSQRILQTYKINSDRSEDLKGE